MLCSLLVASAGAQRVYFIYLQSDAGTPFFARMGDKVFSSAASGYLILSSLRDSTYTFNIGFPNTSAAAEPQFTIPISGGDKGFLIKNIEGTYQLFDLQTLNLVKPGTPQGQTAVYMQNPDAFTRTLSQASNDPSLLQVSAGSPVVKREPEATVSVQKENNVTPPPQESIVVAPQVADTTAQKAALSKTVAVTEDKVSKDTTAIAAITSLQDTTVGSTLPQPSATTTTISADNSVSQSTEPPAVKEPIATTQSSETVNVDQTFIRSRIVRRSESSTTQGFGLVFLDQLPEGGTDTIRLLIPNNPYLPAERLVPATTATTASEVQTSSTISPSNLEQAGQVSVSKKNNCRYEAGESDFIKLRRNMAARASEEAMVAEARKAFKVRCYSVDYLRRLSMLFAYDEARYLFLESAYTATTDVQNFSGLASEFKDSYYTNRFKALVAR